MRTLLIGALLTAALCACSSKSSEEAEAPAKPRECGAAEIPLSTGECRAVGVPLDGCASGFSHDGAGGCVPILPDGDCPEGQLAVPGDAACHSVSPCTGERFGAVREGPNTLFVDATASAIGADGSIAKPFATIQAALDAASDGATIGVAAGTYAEAIKIKRRVALRGACAEKVAITGASGAFAAIDIASTSELSDVAVSSGGFGVVVTNARDVLLERIIVRDTKSGGVYVANGGPGSSATLRGSLVARATGAGASAGSGTLRIERSLIRDTKSDSRRDWGYGVRAERFGPPDSPSAQPAEVVVQQSVIARNLTGGVLAQGSQLTLEGSVVRDVDVRPRDGAAGEGVIGLFFRGAARVNVVQSFITRTHTAGIAMYGGELTIDRTTIASIASNGQSLLGMGVLARPSSVDMTPIARASLTMTASRITDVRHVGVLILGADATITSTLLRDVAASAIGFGDGLGLAAFRDARGVTLETTVTASELLLRGAARAGIAVGGATLSLTRSLSTCNQFDLDVEAFFAKDQPHPFKLEDGGGNRCGCDRLGTCNARTEGLEPASAP